MNRNSFVNTLRQYLLSRFPGRCRESNYLHWNQAQKCKAHHRSGWLLHVRPDRHSRFEGQTLKITVLTLNFSVRRRRTLLSSLLGTPFFGFVKKASYIFLRYRLPSGDKFKGEAPQAREVVGPLTKHAFIMAKMLPRSSSCARHRCRVGA